MSTDIEIGPETSLIRENYVLFDLDGTLTQPRGPISKKIASSLASLYKVPKCTVGIVSGSPYSYIRQQMGASLYMSPEKTLIMPCNGTQLLKWEDAAQDYTLCYEKDMKQYLWERHGAAAYHTLVCFILSLQEKFVANNLDFLDLTGHFMSYRKSMLNWSPVGREAQSHQRDQFIILDKKHNIRKLLCESLREWLDITGFCDVDLLLGGSTSIDIHPSGWDKTHALRHCGPGNIWFVGDKCTPHGNDYSLWKVVSADNRGFSTKGPNETFQIIRDIILPGIQKR